MAVAPSIVGAIIDATKTDSTHGYFWASFFWACVCVVGTALNTWLYFEDINNNGGQLNKIHKGDNIQDLLTSPTGGERKRLEIQNSQDIAPQSKQYLLQPGARDALKKSMAKRSMAK